MKEIFMSTAFWQGLSGLLTLLLTYTNRKEIGGGIASVAGKTLAKFRKKKPAPKRRNAN